MAIITKKGRPKPYSYSICTDEILPTGKHKYIYGPYFATKKEAKEAEAIAISQLSQGTYIEPSKVTVNELLDAFIASKSDLSPGSLYPMRSFAKRIGRQPLGSIQLNKVTLIHVEKYRAFLLSESGLSAQTIREDLSFLKSAFEWAVSADLIYRNPARKIKLPPKQPPKGMHVPIEILLQILRIIKAFDYSNLYMPFLLGGMCGMRISETLAVRANVLDFREVSVTNNLLRHNGVMQFSKTKTRTSIREIPMLNFVRHEINEYQSYIAQAEKEAINRYNLLLSTPGCIAVDDAPWRNNLGLLIVFPDNGRPMCRDHVERRWRRLKKQCPEWLKLLEKYPLLAKMRHHDFRHSFGSNLRDRGVDIVDICEILGHSDVSFTARTYALPLENTHQKAMDKYENAIKGLLP
ncbi:tyrosine-type recombinase/integrase [Phascolarctobacterium succinatutens]|jgi:integrase|uniref:site-specific integrase n=1 Tax=Phascolarctobacterium succinatutens TaxID=626940 RepID=UPI002053EADF|nr:tyrosine-type recombinase/integrase [Phascolarctobacterium succinatutens]DAL12387.1 MAG TPA_asm: Integrase [Caudoviricetes sp.]